MVFLANMYAAGIATGFPQLAMEFHVGNAKLVDLISYPVLALGVGNIFWTPTAVCLGKRPTIIAALIVFVAGIVWSIKASTFNSLVASRVVACFAAGSIDSIGPAIVAGKRTLLGYCCGRRVADTICQTLDLYMERHFASGMAIFSLSLSGGSQVGPMIAGFLIKAKGWRWFFILCAILAAANLVAVLFLYPETNYRRVLYEGETAQEADKEAVQMIEYQTGDKALDSQVAGSAATDLKTPYAGSYWRDLISFRNRGTETSGLLGWPRQFSLPFRFILVPQVLFATISYGVFLGG